MHLSWHNQIDSSQFVNVGLKIPSLGKKPFSLTRHDRTLVGTMTALTMYNTEFKTAIRKKAESTFPVLIIDGCDETFVQIDQISMNAELELINCQSFDEAISLCSSIKFELIIINSELKSLSGFDIANILQGLYTDHRVEFLFILDKEVSVEISDLHSSNIDILYKPLQASVLNLKIQNHLLRSKHLKEIQVTRDLLEQTSAKLKLKSESHTRSIQYAKLIQERILPSIDYLENKFPESFIIYEPKEIIGGDFYMMMEINSRIIIVSADCTGHGVPGAMLSMVGYGFIKSIIHENRIFEPGNILTLLNQKIKNFFGKDSQVATHGMDVSIVSFRTDKQVLEYASSRRPILISECDSIVELKGDNLSIGDEVADNFTFQTYSHPISTSFWIYQFSDGITDQFGGNFNKKFGKKTFKELIDSIKNESSKEQKNLIYNAFTKWKGNYKQTDDITVVGKYFAL